MTEPSDILERMERRPYSYSLMIDAAAEIRRLRAENEVLRAALKPFAEYGATLKAVGIPGPGRIAWNPDNPDLFGMRGPVVEDCFVAARLLECQ